MRACVVAVASTTFLSLGLLGSSARATDCSGPDSPCINDDPLWVHAGPSRFVAVASADTIATGQIGFGLVATYLSRPVVLHVPAPGGAGTDEYAVNDQANGTFLWAYGVSPRLELDLAMPLTFGQGGTGLAPISGGTGLKDTAVRDMRFGFAYALLPVGGAWGLATRLEVSAPTGDADQFAGERSSVFAPSLAGQWQAGRFFTGVEVGARLRPTTELLGARIGTQLVLAVGAGYDLLGQRDLLSVTVEAWALPTFAEQDDVQRVNGVDVLTPNGKHITPAEWQLSVRSAPLSRGDLSLQASGGTEIPFGDTPILTEPRFRFTLGVRWAPVSAPPALSAPPPPAPSPPAPPPSPPPPAPSPPPPPVR
jgi:hypothetical protein